MKEVFDEAIRAAIGRQKPKLKDQIIKTEIERKEEELRFSAMTGNYDDVRKLLHAGVDFNCKNQAGLTPVILAAIMGHKKVIELLQDKGADPDISDQEGLTPIMWATKTHKPDVIRYFIERKVDLHGERNVKSIRLNRTNKDGLSWIDMYFGDGQDADKKLEELSRNMRDGDKRKFYKILLSAGTRAKCHNIVSAILQKNMNAGTETLHKILINRDRNDMDDTFWKTPIEWAVSNQDTSSITAILHFEKRHHSNSHEEGLHCLRSHVTNENLLKWTIEQFSGLYEQEVDKKRGRGGQKALIIGLIGIFPRLISLIFYVYDVYSDIDLTTDYYQRSDFVTDPEVGLEYSCNYTVNSTCCLQREPNEYSAAFVFNLVCIICPILALISMSSREIHDYIKVSMDKKEDHQKQAFMNRILGNQFCRWTIAILLAIPCSLLFLIYIAARNVKLVFKHSRSIIKSHYQKKLEDSEYLWGNLITLEAGLESSGQLVLQVWLLSAVIHPMIMKEGFWGVIQKGGSGILYYITFSHIPVDDAITDIEKSLGKLVITTISLVFSVAGCYKILKREAFDNGSMVFIYLSLLAQISARILSLGLYFTAAPKFVPWFPILLVIHILLVALIKGMFSKECTMDGRHSRLVSVLNVIASSLVYVKITPLEKDPEKLNPKKVIREQERHNSTFLVQFLFFIVVLVENVLFSIYPLVKGDTAENEGLPTCLGNGKYYGVIWVVFLWMMSWICQVLHYKTIHPWKQITGKLLFLSYLFV